MEKSKAKYYKYFVNSILVSEIRSTGLFSNIKQEKDFHRTTHHLHNTMQEVSLLNLRFKKKKNHTVPEDMKGSVSLNTTAGH